MFLKLARVVVEFLFFNLMGAKVYGRENVPMKGGAIVAPNHCSNWDPLLAGVALPRMVYFMAKEELFRNYFMNKICRALGAFPLHRGAIDKTAMRTSFSILKRGDLLGIFPEGTRVHGGKLGRFHSGMASLALRTGMPIVPMALIGTATAFSPKEPIMAVIGKPVSVGKGKPTADNIEKVNNIVRNEIENLIKEYRGRVK